MLFRSRMRARLRVFRRGREGGKGIWRGKEKVCIHFHITLKVVELWNGCCVHRSLLSGSWLENIIPLREMHIFSIYRAIIIAQIKRRRKKTVTGIMVFLERYTNTILLLFALNILTMQINPVLDIYFQWHRNEDI